MKKLKLVALLAVLALTVAAFVTMLVMPASAAANTSKTVADSMSGSTETSNTQASDAAAISAGYIGRFGDTEGAGAVYVKSLKGAMAKFGTAGYTKFNLLVNIGLAARFDFSPANADAACIFNGNGCTITTTDSSSGTHRFYGKVTYQNVTFTGAVANLLQVCSSNVVYGSGTVIENTKANGHPIIINAGTKVTIDGATVIGTVNNTNGVIVPWDQGCTIDVKSGTVKNLSTDADHGATALCFYKQKTTINISGGYIEAIRPINFPSADMATSKLTITGGTLTCKDPSGTNNSYCITWSGSTSNSTINITGGTFNGEGTFLACGGSNNTLNFGGTAKIITARESRGFIQDGSSTNNTVNITGGTITSAGYGFVNPGKGFKASITGGTITAKLNNFIHLCANSGQQFTIGGDATIICGESTTVHERNFATSNVAGAAIVTIEGGTIYCGDVYETGGSTDAVVNIKGGTIYCENALYSTGGTAVGVMNISGGDITCTNGALYVTSGGALLNIYDGAKINALSLVRVRAYSAEEAASDGVGRLRMYGGNVTTTSDAINLELGSPKDYAYKSDIEIYGGKITTPYNIIDAAQGGAGTISIYGGEFLSTGRVAEIENANSTFTLNIYGGVFKSLYNSTDDGANTTITTGLVFMSAGNSHVNVYGGRFYILTDLNDTTKLANTGAHLVPWAGAIDCMNFYAGEFYGGTHVQQRLAHASGKVDTANSTYITMPSGGYKMLPVTKEGASIRLSADSMGIRFQSTISKAALDHAKTFGTVTYGTIITPLDFGLKLGAGLLNSSSNYVKIAATSAGTTTDASGNVTFNAALTNIQAANLGRQFVACAYIEITTTGGEVITIYSTDKAVRSIDEVAKAALADYKTEAEITDSNKDTYKYMTTIYCDKTTGELYRASTTPVYTRFNNAQIAAIAKQTVIG